MELSLVKKSLEDEAKLCFDLSVPLKEASNVIQTKLKEVEEYHTQFEQKVINSVQRIIDSVNSRKIQLLESSKQGRTRSISLLIDVKLSFSKR